jgi:hypothetical protein
MRLDHILSGKHAALIASEGERERKRVNGLSLANHRRRYGSEPLYRVTFHLRSRLKAALRAKGAKKLSVGMLGCSDADLKWHLESLFTEGMTWENYGEWHVDHIKPCSSFNLLDAAEQRKCFHYSNLQPLWAIDNFRKSNKVG